MSSDGWANGAAVRPSGGGPPAIRAERLGKQYRLGLTEGGARYRTLREEVTTAVRRGRKPRGAPRSFWAVRDLAVEIHQGERVGIIGRNGSGKSTLLKMLARITAPTEGRAEVRGRVGALLEVGTGFHPELTGRDNIFLSASILGTRRAEVRAKLDEIVDFAGVEQFLDTPVKRYSSGMYLRLAFAVAAHLEPEILLVDEVLAVGDADFQKKCLGRMAEIGSGGRTVLFVSHSMPAVLRLCDRVLLLDAGRLVSDGRAVDVVRQYLDSGSGTSAERSWANPAVAPGDNAARLKQVRVLCDGRTTDEVDIRRPIDVEVEFWRLGGKPGLSPTVCLEFSTIDGVCLFTTVDFAGVARGGHPAGHTVQARCRIPGNFLAEGHVTVMAAVCSYNPETVHALERDAVSFVVVDRSEGDGVRGPFKGNWPGAVRPELAWTATSAPMARADVAEEV
ncbi:MAG TPA: ABC transporter ATP-binding protein [Egibacteraceae bacterium]|jgi:lipopolysaccharide transport system ATP-binding protein|nr:ABC transporter ATP-binding protein [Egibacteraceae bacterium]